MSFWGAWSARKAVTAVKPGRTSPPMETDSRWSPQDAPSCVSELAAAVGIRRPTSGRRGMTVCTPASVQICTPTTAAIWLGTTASTATPKTPYTAITTNPG